LLFCQFGHLVSGWTIAAIVCQLHKFNLGNQKISRKHSKLELNANFSIKLGQDVCYQVIKMINWQI